MFKNYLKFTLRTIRKHKVFTTINMLGLAIGIACCTIILIHIQDEFSFDRFHEKADRIFRVTRHWQRPEGGKKAANTPAAVAPTLKKEFPVVENFARIMFSFPQSVLIGHGDRRFYEDGFYWADSTIFEVFSFKLKSGNPKTVLTQINSIVLTEKMARKYFPNPTSLTGYADPIGKILTVDGWTKDYYTIAGVLAEVPHNSHLQFDFLGSIRGADTRYTYLYSGEGQWSNSVGYAYILLREGAKPDELNAQLVNFGERHLGEFAKSRGFKPVFKLQALSDIHLGPGLSVEPTPTNDITYIYILVALAGLIMLIACINYMNLATARAVRRAREVGMRKVLGAQRTMLIRQFLGEPLLMSLFALLLALFLVELFLPVFNGLAGKNFVFNYWQQPMLFAATTAIGLLVGLLAGSYPAFALSAFRPALTIRGEIGSTQSGLLFRKGLITVQFVASGFLIIATLVVLEQLSFVRTRSLGFDKEQIAVIPIRVDIGNTKRDDLKTAKQVFLNHSNIVSVSAAAGVPGRTMMIDGFPVRPPVPTARRKYICKLPAWMKIFSRR